MTPFTLYPGDTSMSSLDNKLNRKPTILEKRKALEDIPADLHNLSLFDFKTLQDLVLYNTAKRRFAAINKERDINLKAIKKYGLDLSCFQSTGRTLTFIKLQLVKNEKQNKIKRALGFNNDGEDFER